MNACTWEPRAARCPGVRQAASLFLQVQESPVPGPNILSKHEVDEEECALCRQRLPPFLCGPRPALRLQCPLLSTLLQGGQGATCEGAPGTGTCQGVGLGGKPV